MKQSLAAFLILLLWTSCSKQNRFPEKNSFKISIEELQLVESGKDVIYTSESLESIDYSSLQQFVKQFESKDQAFVLSEFENDWSTFFKNIDFSKCSRTDLKNWIAFTGLLLEITGKAEYGEELERISNFGESVQSYIRPYVFTKKLDNIYVNLFQPVRINYEHSMKGEVTFRQETDYPKSGSVKLHFGMTERRYIELFIRIPSWAEGTHVTVKGVKYFAPPGDYCHIVKKWKEGDLVEIELPLDKMPL
jgi:hypothetical protein